MMAEKKILTLCRNKKKSTECPFWAVSAHQTTVLAHKNNLGFLLKKKVAYRVSTWLSIIALLKSFSSLKKEEIF
jgi:hypothetical protein